MKPRPRLATTVVTTALGPKIPPFVGDAPGVPLATTAVVAALGPKLPPFLGD
jgi:hypothetical protein